jgi:hypothetical protein
MTAIAAMVWPTKILSIFGFCNEICQKQKSRMQAALESLLIEQRSLDFV